MQNDFGLSNVNITLSYTGNTARAFDDAIFRNLTGVQPKTIQGTDISFSDLDGKVAFGGINAPTASSEIDFGLIAPTVNLDIVSDMVSPNVGWAYNVVSGDASINLVQVDNRTASISLNKSDVGVFTSNVAVTANVSFAGHVIGTATQYINLSGTVNSPNFQIIGFNTAISNGFIAQTASTTLIASSNVANASIRFTTDKSVGVMIVGNTITFSTTAAVLGSNTQTYALTTDLLYLGRTISTDKRSITVTANFLSSNIAMSAANGVISNVFANNGSVISSLQYTATHSVPTANVVWSVENNVGATPVLNISSDKTTANVYLTIANGSFSMLKSTGIIRASLQYANGYILNEKTFPYTIRAGAYGLSYIAPVNFTSTGYQAQTASTTAAASWKAGSFLFNTIQSSDSPSTVTISTTYGTGFATCAASVSATSGTALGTANFYSQLTYDGIILFQYYSTVTLSAQRYVPYVTVYGTSITVTNGCSVFTSDEFRAQSNVPSATFTYEMSNPNIKLTQLPAYRFSLSLVAPYAKPTEIGDLSVSMYDANGSYISRTRIASISVTTG